MKLTPKDREKIRALLVHATEERNLVDPAMLKSVLEGMAKGDLSAAAKAAAKSAALPMEQLSISHPAGKLDEQDVLTIASEFGLGDRSTWTMSMPAAPPAIKAYHIIRALRR